MEISPETTTHVFLQGKECLHVLATTDQLRVRWMREGVWLLRWDARIDEDGQYVDERLDGELLHSLADGLEEYPRAALLFQSMRDASLRLPLYPNPDIVRELKWFVMEDDAPIPSKQADNT